MLEYPKQNGAVVKTEIKKASALKKYFSQPRDDASVRLRLFVVEDLSREVIETLGSKFDIDPSFFREHLVDYVWYNISKSIRQIPKTTSPGKSNIEMANVVTDSGVKRTGGEIRQTWISCREDRTGSRCGL